MFKFINRKIKVLFLRILKPFVDEIILTTYRVYGYRERLEIHPTAQVTNSLFNTFSGKIVIGPNAFTGHNVSFLTGTHNYKLKDSKRLHGIPYSGHDIIVKNGAWIGSNSTIIGPCIIGTNSVIAAGSVVSKDVHANTIVGGCPSKFIKEISFD